MEQYNTPEQSPQKVALLILKEQVKSATDLESLKNTMLDLIDNYIRYIDTVHTLNDTIDIYKDVVKSYEGMYKPDNQL